MVLLLLFLFLPLPHHPLLHFCLKAWLSQSPRPRSPSQARPCLKPPPFPPSPPLPCSPPALSLSSCVSPCSLFLPQTFPCRLLTWPLSAPKCLPLWSPTPPATAWHFGRGLPNVQTTAYQVLSLPAHLLPSRLPVCLFHHSLFIFLSYLFDFLSLTLTLPLSPICTVFPALPWEDTPVVELPVLDVPRCRDPGLTLPSWV